MPPSQPISENKETACQEITSWISGAEDKITDLKVALDDLVTRCEDEVKSSPGKTLLLAAAAGYFLNQLPLRSIVAAKVRLASGILPPVLFLYGAAKLYEFSKSQQKESHPDR